MDERNEVIRITAPKNPADAPAYVRKRVEQTRFSQAIDKSELMGSQDPALALGQTLDELRQASARSLRRQNVVAKTGKALGLTSLALGAWAIFAGDPLAGWAAGGSAVVALGSAFLHGSIHARERTRQSDLALAEQLHADALRAEGKGRDHLWQQLRQRGVTGAAKLELQKAFEQWQRSGIALQVEGDSTLEPVQAFADGKTLKYREYDTDNRYHTVRDIEDLEFLDRRFGASDGTGLTDLPLAEAITRCLADDANTFRRDGYGRAHPLEAYRQVLGKPIGPEKVTSKYVNLTREGLVFERYLRDGEDLGLADPELAEQVKQMAENGYELAASQAAYYSHLVGDRKAALRFKLPDSSLEVPFTAQDLLQGRVQDKEQQVERLTDTYLWSYQKRWGESFKTSSVLARAFEFAGEGVELKLATRLMARLTEAELSTRLAPEQEHPWSVERAKEDVRSLRPFSASPVELEERGEVLASLLERLPRHHAQTAFLASLEPVGDSSLKQRAELFHDLLFEETYTLSRRQVSEIAELEDRVFVNRYIDKVCAQFAPGQPDEVQRLRRRLSGQVGESEFAIEEDQVRVGDFSLQIAG